MSAVMPVRARESRSACVREADCVMTAIDVARALGMESLARYERLSAASGVGSWRKLFIRLMSSS